MATNTRAQDAITLDLQCDYEEIMLAEIETMDPYDEHMSAYHAHCVENKFFQLIQQRQYKCRECEKVLTSADDLINDTLLAMKYGEKEQPSRSTMKIVIFANAIMRIHFAECDGERNFDALLKSIRDNIDIQSIYNNFYTHHEIDRAEDSHKIEFVSRLIRIYIALRFKYMSKKKSRTEEM